MPSYAWNLIIVLAIVVSAAVGLTVFGLRQKARARRWAEAWRKLEAQPAAALTLFEQLYPSGRRRSYRPDHRARSARAKLGQALCLLRLGRIEEAEKALAESRKVAKPSEVDLVLLCKAYLAVPPAQLPETAIPAWARLLTLREDVCDPETRKRVEAALRAQLAVSPGDSHERVERVVQICRRVVEAGPNLAWAHSALGVALAELGQHSEAIEALKKAIELDPGMAEAHSALGRAYAGLKDHSHAHQALSEAHRLAPSGQTAYEAAASGLAWAEQMDEASQQRRELFQSAFDLFTEASEANPSDPLVWVGLGRAHWRLGKRANALKTLHKAIIVGPQSGVAHAVLGQYLLAEGEREKARSALRKASHLEPELTEAARLAGDLDYEDGDYRAALIHYRRAHSRGDADGEMIARMARCCLEVGKPAGAVELLADRESLDASSRLVLGRGYAQLNRWEEA
ncbi:MAG: tetratricopeptide repeat protein, partial [Planctomycetota bacterium]